MTTAKQWTVYGLIDPRSPRAIRYIGVTTDLRRRERQHRFKPSGKNNRGLVDWKQSLRTAGVELLAIPLETHRNLEAAQEAERYFIRELRALDRHDLLNIHHGGAWCPDTAKSPEHRAKIGAAHRGRHGPPANAKQRTALAKGWAMTQAPGHVESLETRAKIAEAHRGKKLSPEHIEKVRRANLGRKRSPEAVAKMAAALRGRPKSLEHRMKLSAAKKGVPLSAEHRANMAKANQGRHHTPEARLRMSEAQRIRHQRYPMTTETKAKIGAGNRGKKRNPDHRAKMATGHKAWAAKRAEERGAE